VGCDPVTCGIYRRPRGDFSGCRRERVIRPLAASQNRRNRPNDHNLQEGLRVTRLSRLGAMGAGEQCDTDYKSLESDSPTLLWCSINAFKIKR
jgi:hypothetical protein